MTKELKYLLVILFAFFSIGWVACTQERGTCLTPKSAFLNVESIHLSSDTATVFVDTALPAAVFMPFTNLAPVEYIFSKVALFTISLSPDSNVCRWAFTADSSRHHFDDTLTFYYKGSPHFLSNACGYTYYYNLDSVHTTHSTIDSVHIINTSVTNAISTKHVQIYIHPDF